MPYKLKLLRPNDKPAATLTTPSPPMVAATIEAWLDNAPAEWFDEHGELTMQLTHNGQPVDTSVLAEHIAQFHDLTDSIEEIDAARRGNRKRQANHGS